MIDVVVRTSEVHRTELITLPGTLSFADLPTVEIVAVDLYQHFAEKLHALVHDYGDCPSRRVQDLADLILFIDGGLKPTQELVGAVGDVFLARGSAGAPVDLPDPPADWPSVVRPGRWRRDVRPPGILGPGHWSGTGVTHWRSLNDGNAGEESGGAITEPILLPPRTIGLR